MKRMLMTLLLCILAIPAAAQDLPYAGITDGLLTIRQNGAVTRVGEPSRITLHLASGPGMLAYTWFDPAASVDYTLTMLPDGGAPVDITADLQPEFPPVIHNGALHFARQNLDVQPEMGAGGGTSLGIDVLRVTTPDTAPEVVATFEYVVGCGGGSPYPMDAVYSSEAGFMGNGLIFEVTPFGILHSTSCEGRGVALTDSGITQVLSGDFARGSLSPDGTQMAGVRIIREDAGFSTELVILDLTDGQLLPTQTDLQPDQVHWGADGAIYFTTRAQSGTVDLDVTDADIAAFREATGQEIPVIPAYDAALYRYNIIPGTADPLWSAADAWAIGRLDSTPSALYFSVIPGAEPWVEAVLAGDDDPLALRVPSVQPDVYTLVEGEASLFAEDVGLFMLR